ncbi:DUF1983 domain-containing protein, partial [Escherichia coli]
VPGIYAGRYLVRVRAINAAEISSGWGYSEEKTLTGKVGNPPKPVGFIASENVVFGIELNWGFPANTDDTLKTEIQYSLTGTEDDAMLLADVPYPQRKYQQMGLKAGQIFWYRAQLVDRSGNESGYTEWVRGQASIDVSDITDVILEDMKGSDTFKDMIENAVDSNEKIAGMADEIKNHADELEQQAKDILENADGLAQAEVKIDEISVSMDGMTGGVKNSAIAIIQNGLAQVVSRRSQTATNAGNSASIDRVDTTIADTSQAVARALVTLDAEAGGNISNSTDLTETLADFTQASATKINTLTVKSGENSAAINVNAQAIADVNGNLSAMYNIKVGVSSNGQYYAAGMGIGVQNTPSGMQSQVIFLADRFAVTTAAGNSVALPFVIQNGETFIRASFIQDGTIENAKIGNYIQSNNYAAGSAGWKLNKAGDAEFNNVTVRGVVYASGGSFTGEIQATSGKFKGTVEAQSFIGDVCNMGVADDLYGEGSTFDMTRTITYMDTANTTKTITVMANLSGVPNYPGSLLGVEITVNGVTKRASAGTSVRDSESGMLSTSGTVMATFRGVTSATVTAKIVFKQGATKRWLRSPTMIVTRGSGSFSYS